MKSSSSPPFHFFRVVGCFDLDGVMVGEENVRGLVSQDETSDRQVRSQSSSFRRSKLSLSLFLSLSLSLFHSLVTDDDDDDDDVAGKRL